ncbi:MAG UNVERIFIED_CONTAM: hypothetical protein LVR18_09840 [Planctomycetaceae bacterium]|jgi:hypothetical protein
MTSPGDNSGKRPTNPTGRWASPLSDLAGLPDDVGGEVLFDDYDDQPTVKESAEPTADIVTAAAQAETPPPISAGESFDEDLDDLIVFSDDEDDDEDDDDDVADEISDEDFDFGGDDEDEEEDDEDDLEDDEDDNDDDDDEDAEDEDEFGFGSGVKNAPRRSANTRSETAAPDRSRSSGCGSSESPRRTEPVSQGQDASEKPVAEKPRPNVVSGAGDDETYWNEVDRWVWDEPTSQSKTAAPAETEPEDTEAAESGSPGTTAEEADADGSRDAGSGRRRGRRRGGRGRNRRRRGDTPGSDSRDFTDSDNDADVSAPVDDLSEILFEEDHEDVVSVSAGSARAQRRSEESRLPVVDDADSDDDEAHEAPEPSETAERSDRRGCRGRRGRGRDRGQDREETRPERSESLKRPAARRESPVDEDDFEPEDERAVGFDDEEEPVLRRCPQRSRRDTKATNNRRSARSNQPRRS